MTDIVISGGQTSSGIALAGGDTLTVLSGGTASKTTINSGGIETVSSGGIDLGATVNSGGTQIVRSGGFTSGVTLGNVFQAGAQIVFGTASATTITSGGVETVSSGGVDLGATVMFGGDQIVEAGGFAGGGIVSGGGSIMASGVVSATTIHLYGNAYIASGGSATAINIYGREIVDAGAIDTGARIATGGTQYVSGTANGAVLSGGQQIVEAQGSASGTTVGSGGTQIVLSGGTAIGAVLSGVSPYVNQVVSSGGIAIGTAALSGGKAFVLAGGTAIGMGVFAGGSATIVGGTVIDTVISGPGAVLILAGGPVVSGGISFAGSGGRLQITDIASPAYPISGFAAGNFIDQPNLPFDSAGTAVLGPGNVLQITQFGSTFDLQLDPTQDFSGEFFRLSPAAGGGTIITEGDLAPPGGQFVFGLAPGYAGVTLGINNSFDGTGAPSQSPNFANLNIEVFTESFAGTSANLYAGFQVGVIDSAGYLLNGFLTGTELQLFTGDYVVLDAVTGVNTPARIILGSGNQTVIGAAGDTLIGGSGNQVLNAFTQPGAETILGGSGNTTIYGGAGDSIVAGAGSTYIDGRAGGMRIGVGSGGTDIIIGSTVGGAPDTITGGAAAVQIQGLGSGDVVDFTAQTGDAAINATAGNIRVTLGSGAATVFGGFGDTIAFGTASQYVDGSAGGMLIQIGSGGIGAVDNVIGSGAGGGGDTIVGGSSTLRYNPQTDGGGDLIDLSGSAGNATINAFRADGNDLSGSDTIIAGNGSDSVWGGDSDRIGVGNGALVGGTHLWTHSTTIAGAAIGFGTNDTVVATSYDTVGGTATVNSTIPGASSARVTVGDGAGDFDTTFDFIFYPNETAQTNSAIVATSQAADGGASSIVTLPDGTVMTLLGVTQSELQAALTAGTLFS